MFIKIINNELIILVVILHKVEIICKCRKIYKIREEILLEIEDYLSSSIQKLILRINKN